MKEFFGFLSFAIVFPSALSAVLGLLFLLINTIRGDYEFVMRQAVMCAVGSACLLVWFVGYVTGKGEAR